METAIVWFRRDLRVHDNETLAAAVRDADRILPVYCFDPAEFTQSQYVDEPKTGPHRVTFLRESVADLRESVRERGGELAVRHGAPTEELPRLAREVDVDAVYFQTIPATEEFETERAVRRALDADGVAIERFWTHTLYHVNDLPTPVESIQDTFTPWRKEVEQEAEGRDTEPTPERVETPTVEAGDVPTNTDLGVTPAPPPDDRGVLAFEGGERAGLDRLETYVWTEDRLREYKETRNGLLGAGYSSKLSPWLALGCLSPRYIGEEVDRYERERVANESTYWLVFELLWRDFFQFQFAKHGARFFGPQGIRGDAAGKDWDHDREAFARWAAGETGVPFVDANMRELNATGFMSNRGRQNVTSFLTDALNVDWRWGAAYFESRLVDYDVCSNWGNWAYQAGVGNDSRDGYFDVVSQAEYYDPNAAYVRHWLPELEELPADYAHRPWTLSDELAATYGVELGVDYPQPMLDVEGRYRDLS
ncbi:DASH family cryptochrome [Halorarius litoreus]|uniref:DASH family cryptochrome n=1 Tax=Halorarius litoreus TaxID=2962676 RepID=UPI0020CE82FE|nr:DASH family cryptochrome [Halorarius litoreus]